MSSKSISNRKKLSTATRYRPLAVQSALPHSRAELSIAESQCHIVERGGRRGGGKRYWCLQHRADATATYGRRAETCSGASALALPSQFDINLDAYPGGVALWGAVPAVYDTTRHPLDRGVHIHARITPEGDKEIDRTFRSVRLLGARLPDAGIVISELDAIYFMVSSVLGLEMKQVVCRYCGEPHLDRDWFSVHAHRRHLCSACGRQFSDTEVGIGNPIIGVREACGMHMQKPTPSPKTLEVDQADFEGGIQLWGSNPALIWTSARSEEEGIHVHAFRTVKDEPDVEDTYTQVTIDGIELDSSKVRILMAQSALPHIRRRVRSISCPNCEEPQFDTGEMAFTPRTERHCPNCGCSFVPRGRLRKVIANPLVRMLERLAARAPRPPQEYGIDLPPEAPRSAL